MAVVQFPIEITSAPRRYAPVGRCIYCNADRNLRDEHVVPYGISGDAVVLPKASCKKCERITGAFEQVVLRHMWWPMRARMGLPSRTKAPASFNLRKVNKKRHELTGQDQVCVLPVEQVPSADFPFAHVTYTFPPPGLLVGRAPSDPIEVKISSSVLKSEFQKYASNKDEGLLLERVDLHSLIRLVAKIAHGFATAELGIDAFRPTLREFILGKQAKELQWIGCDPETPPATPSLFDTSWVVQAGNGKIYVTVAVRLFSFLAWPVYRVIVGELDERGLLSLAQRHPLTWTTQTK